MPDSLILTPAALQRLAPEVGTKAGTYTGILNQAMGRFNITTPLQIAHFLGQLLTESDGLTCVREGMNYSAERLMVVWPKRFPTIAIAKMYERQPQKLANFVYANRMGNGGPETNDGWDHRGTGWFQLTGKTNQEMCAVAFGLPFEGISDWLATTKGAAQSSAWFWDKNHCNTYADQDDLDAVSDAVNLGRQTEKKGDAIGYAKRAKMTAMCKSVLGA